MKNLGRERAQVRSLGTQVEEGLGDFLSEYGASRKLSAILGCTAFLHKPLFSRSVQYGFTNIMDSQSNPKEEVEPQKTLEGVADDLNSSLEAPSDAISLATKEPDSNVAKKELAPSYTRRMSPSTEWPAAELAQNLVRLELEWNFLTEVPAFISSLQCLENLNVARNHISKIVEGGLDQIVGLIKLDLSCNLLTSLPDSMSRLTNLRYLDVSKNRLTTWPTQVHALKLIENFGVGSNSAILGAIPDSFGESGLNQLHTLRIGETGIKELPPSIAKLTTLTQLDLEINSISSWPDSFASLSSLICIDLMLNDFTSTPHNISSKIYPNLGEVRLIGNPIPLPQTLSSSEEENDQREDGSASSSDGKAEKVRVEKFFRFGSCAPPSTVHEDRVYLGSIESAYNKHKLVELGVTHVVSLVEQGVPYPGRFEYLHIALPDVEATDLYSRFDEACKFIDLAIKNGGSCLIHCMAGMSRSATITIAWTMKTYKLRYETALEFVKSKRPIINPNDGFIRQLQQWEKELSKRGVKFHPDRDYSISGLPSPGTKCVIS